MGDLCRCFGFAKPRAGGEQPQSGPTVALWTVLESLTEAIRFPERGSIACNYLGLHDDPMAGVWAGFMGHSHYVGSFRHPAPDEPLWRERYKRLGERPLLFSHERSVVAIPIGP